MNSEIAKTPMKRMADVEEIADCIVFLASPMASFMTGSSLLVDGGYTINWVNDFGQSPEEYLFTYDKSMQDHH